MTKWRKRGRVYVPPGDVWWARGYTHTPTLEIIDGALIRVYFAALDKDNFGRVGYVDLDVADPMRIVAVAPEPALDLGALGAFDDSGVVPSCIVTINELRYLYYIGFQRAERVPYMLFTGLAVGDDKSETFSRHSCVPILDRTNEEPFSRSGPFVLRDQGILKMWYWSCRRWEKDERGIHYSNVIRYATSHDGIMWQVDPRICLAPDEPDEYSIGRPCVVRQNDRYRMWFSARSFSKRYIIGYAESDDGIAWTRDDAAGGMTPSKSGWDSEMVCYPYVVDIGGRLLMFYNGNQHGRTGFGYATLGE